MEHIQRTSKQSKGRPQIGERRTVGLTLPPAQWDELYRMMGYDVTTGRPRHSLSEVIRDLILDATES